MRSPSHYILDGHRPVPEPDVLKWAEWFEAADRIVKHTALMRGDPPEEYCTVSTVFLGLDHNWSAHGPPVLFETMVFLDGETLDFQTRCATWDDAERMHVAACNDIEKRFQNAPIAKNWRRPHGSERM